VALVLYVGLHRRRKVAEVSLLAVPGASEDHCSPLYHGIAILFALSSLHLLAVLIYSDVYN